MNKTIISYFLIFLLTFCSQAMGSSDRQIYDPKDTKFLEEAEGKEALKWAKERTEKELKNLLALCRNISR
ncbi:MAG: hypothetical protein ACRYE8_05430 [Janthinobacterium lividum]